MTARTRLGAWFTPQLLGLHAFAVVAIIVCVFMGLWQLGVYDQRQQSERAEQNDVPRVALAEIWSKDEFLTTRQNLRPVTVTGEFLPADQQFWVTGKEHDGREGVWLVAPVVVDDAILMVARGWTPKVTEFPAVPDGTVTFDAVLRASEESESTWDPENRTIGGVRVPAMLNVFEGELWSGYAESQDPAISQGLTLIELPEKSASWTAGGRNLGYGLQWWAFVVFILFMWWRMATEMVNNQRESQDQ